MNDKTVLITGSGSGIGFELAKFFHKARWNLVLVSLLEDELNDAENYFLNISREQKVYTLQKDLTENDSADYIFNYCETEKIEIDVLINNAGFGLYGEHLDLSYKKINEMLMLNIFTLTELCYKFGNYFKKRGGGTIFNTASTASFQPLPFLASYAASKAYVKNFTLAIAKELKPLNINVSILCPGTTKTNFLKTAGIEKTDKPSSFGNIAHLFQADPVKVARSGFRGFIKNRLLIIPGIINRFQYILVSILPNRIITFFVYRVFKRGY